MVPTLARISSALYVHAIVRRVRVLVPGSMRFNGGAEQSDGGEVKALSVSPRIDRKAEGGVVRESVSICPSDSGEAFALGPSPIPIHTHPTP